MTRTVGARRASSRTARRPPRAAPRRPHRPRQLAAGLLGDVEQRPQRARGEERVACPPQDPRRPGVLVGEARVSAVLPAPASPVTSTSRPRELLRTLSSIAASVSSCPERSSRSLACASWVAGAVDTDPLMPPGAILPGAPARRKRGSRTPDRQGSRRSRAGRRPRPRARRRSGTAGRPGGRPSGGSGSGRDRSCARSGTSVAPVDANAGSLMSRVGAATEDSPLPNRWMPDSPIIPRARASVDLRRANTDKRHWGAGGSGR